MFYFPLIRDLKGRNIKNITRKVEISEYKFWFLNKYKIILLALKKVTEFVLFLL